MKLSASTLKNFDYKQFGINHGEKIVLAVIGLALVLALWSTNWTSIKVSPHELSAETVVAKEKIEKQPWPAQKSQELTGGVELDSKVKQLVARVDGAQFHFVTPFSSALHPEKTRISNPHWLPVDDLRADAGVADILLAPGVESPKEDFIRKPPPKPKDTSKSSKERGRKEKKSAKKEVKKPEEPISEEFKPREGGTAFGRSGAPRGMGLNAKALEKRRDKGQFQAPVIEPETASAPKGPKQGGRGVHFVAVRGVYPLRNQVTELMRALGDQGNNRSDVQRLVRFDEPCFKLERQTAQPSGDWGPWEPVDREPVIELLKNESAGYATEHVSDGIMDPAICMPYPDLTFGEWTRFATHPQVEKFALSDEEVEEQIKFEEEIIKRAKEDLDKKRADKKGWESVKALTRDFRILQQQQVGGPGGPAGASVRDQILQKLETKGGDESKVNERERLKDFVQKRASANDHLLLFRYLDVKVEPGKTYRYRVKLVLVNPFHDRNPEEVVDPSIIEGATRETDYSDPTSPVTVPEDARFFLTHVDGRIGAKSLPSIDLDLYQWFISTGTIVNKRNLHLQIGQVIGGKEHVSVLRPVDGTYDIEWVPFATKEALVDVAAGFSLDSTIHADILNELKSVKGKKSPGFVPDQAIVVDGNGSLALLDSLEQQAAHQQTQARYNGQIKAWEPLVKKDKDEDDDKTSSGKLDLRGGGSGATHHTKKKPGGNVRRREKKFQ